MLDAISDFDDDLIAHGISEHLALPLMHRTGAPPADIDGYHATLVSQREFDSLQRAVGAVGIPVPIWDGSRGVLTTLSDVDLIELAHIRSVTS